MRLLTAVLAGLAGPVQALEGVHPVELVMKDGAAIEVAELELTPKGEGWSYRLKMATEPFSEHFLSMRPFKCIEGDAQTLCHLPYPYPLLGEVLQDDWRDLEYRLMFLFKSPGEYGINFENGYIFKIAAEADGLVGRLHEADMNDLASPPPAGVIYPFGEYDLFESEGVWVDYLRVGG